MLSVLIPIYNYDVIDFVKCLSEQSKALEPEVEILCMDDCSDAAFRKTNAAIKALDNVKYVESESNLGRSAIRNAMVVQAKFEHLLFLDCDGMCVSDDYLKNYVKSWNDYDVIYGGRVYSERAPDDHDLYFHWYCGSNREAMLVSTRKLNPYKSFMTNNFLIRKSVYDAVGMDESVVGYGHEDTLFAQELKRAGFRIDHIENPIEHKGIEPVSVFLEKSENGVRNLALLIKKQKVDASIRLVRFYFRIEGLGLMPLLSWMVRRLNDRIVKNLKGPAPNLLWFDLWKLARLYRYMGQ